MHIKNKVVLSRTAKPSKKETTARAVSFIYAGFHISGCCINICFYETGDAVLFVYYMAELFLVGRNVFLTCQAVFVAVTTVDAETYDSPYAECQPCERLQLCDKECANESS